MCAAAALFVAPGCSGDSGSSDTPTAVIKAQTQVEPHTAVVLDGSSSNASSYQWRIDQRPDGSNAWLSDASVADPTMLADIAGEYVVCLTVANGSGTRSPSECVTIAAVPSSALHVELVWSRSDGAETDLDLHYAMPTGRWFEIDTSGNCIENGSVVWWCSPTPDWGPGGVPDGDRSNDPRLDVDNVFGDGPENINQDKLFDSRGFRLGVHHYCDFGNGPAEARVRVYINGEMRFEETRTLAFREFWEVAAIDVGGNTERVEISSIGESFNSGTGECP
jgi:hypothetical protein